MGEVQSKDAEKIALVAGANGLIGSRLLSVLRDAPEFSRVYALTRRPIAQDFPRLANRVVRFDMPLADQLGGVRCHVAFCCLGTTLRDAGSEAGFRAVDQDLILQFAQFARTAGASHFLLVSSVGADPASRNFYLRVKGETEKALADLRFPTLSILQPSLLRGSRPHARLRELAAQPAMMLINPLLQGQWARFRSIDATQVAAAMCVLSRGLRKGVIRYTFQELVSQAQKLTR